jgi:SAM-dependent methyltransferase
MRLRLPLFLLPEDLWERHHLVSRYLKGCRPRTVLDVGGEGLLGRFLPRARVVSTNVEGPQADCVYDGERLPFASASFDAVVTLDVMEHLPSARRPAFVDELFRVTRTHVVIAVPLGTPLHEGLERGFDSSL